MDSHEIGIGVRGRDDVVEVCVGNGVVARLLEGIELEADPVQLANTNVKTKKERMIDTIVICLIGTPPIQVKERTFLTPPILHP